MSTIIPLVVAFVGIGLFADRLDRRAYTLMLLAIVLITAARYIKG